MKGTKKFLAILLAGLSLFAGSLSLVACGETSSSSSSSSSADPQPKGVVYEIIDDTAQVVDYDGTETSVTIEATYEGVAVTEIGNNAFKNSTITSVTIPDSIISIGNSAFNGCTGLTEIVIPNSVTSIGNSAFENCSGFTEFVIPDSVTSIGKSAFCNCTSLTSVTIGSGVKSIGDGAFDFSTALKNITFTGTKAQWNKIDIADSWLTQVQLVTKVVCLDGDVAV